MHRHFLSPHRPLLLTFLILSLIPLWCAAGDDVPEDAIVGDWYTPGQEARIRIYRCQESFCGRIVWIRKEEETGEVILDSNNPDKSLRGRPVRGIEIMREVRQGRGAEWNVGKLYDPKSGKEYKGKAKLEGKNKLVLRGYVLIPLFGRSETWTRAED